MYSFQNNIYLLKSGSRDMQARCETSGRVISGAFNGEYERYTLNGGSLSRDIHAYK
jgi:hypothetical protein